MKDMFQLTDKVAVVTGAGGVICSTLAKDLAAQGAKVALLDLAVENAQKVADEIKAAGGTAIALKANVLDLASLKEAAKSVKATFGRVDILVNGAGGNHPKATTSKDLNFFDLPADALKWVFDLNFVGTVMPTQVFGKTMAEQGEGCVVNIASMASYRPLTRTVAYSAAKSAIVNFTEWMSVHFCQEYSAKIRVNAIAPGFLLTKQNEYLMVDQERNLTPRGRDVIQKTPMQRFGSPDELSGAVIYLCSQAASFVTGIVIPVDGGFNAYAGV